MRTAATVIALALLALAGCGQTAGSPQPTGPAAFAHGTIAISPPPQVENVLPGHPPYLTVRCGGRPQTSRPVPGVDPANPCALAGQLAAAERQVRPRRVIGFCSAPLTTTPKVSGSLGGHTLAMPSCSTILRTRTEQELARRLQAVADRAFPLRRPASGSIELHPPGVVFDARRTTCAKAPGLCLLIAAWQQVVAHPVSRQPVDAVACEMAELPVAQGSVAGRPFTVAYVPCAAGRLTYDRFGVALYRAIAKQVASGVSRSP